MKQRTITYLTDANLITCVIQKDLAEPVLEAAKNAGAQGATISYAQGTGIRERMGLLGVAVEVEREIVQVLVSKDQVDRIFERMYLAGRLDTPGMGYIYAAPLVQAATYIPAHLLEDKDSLSSLGV